MVYSATNNQRFMAHTISLPVQFTFTSQRLKWVLARLNLNRWRRHRRGPWYIGASVLSPPEFERFAYGVDPSKVPTQIRQELPHYGAHLPAKLRSMDIEVLLYVPHNEEPQSLTIDPWQARDEFLSLRRSITDLLVFLNRYGAWRREHLPWDSTTVWGRRPRLAFPEDFWNEQARIRESLKGGAKNWTWRDVLRLSPRPEFPHYVHEAMCCFEAINTATTIDFLKNIRFKICARPDCAKPFPADRTNKIYCEQYCGHLVSVRNKRKRASRPKRRPKTGSTRRK
jgi:hypothetical protein